MAEPTNKITLDGMLDNLNKISQKILDNPIVQKANTDILSSMTKASLSDEKRSLLMVQYNQNLTQTLELAMNFTKEFELINLQKEALEKENLVKDEQLEALKQELLFKKSLETAQKEALEKENLVKNEQLSTAKAQTEGFDMDMYYKASKLMFETSSMLAQVDVETPQWMVTGIKKGIDLMTKQKIPTA